MLESSRTGYEKENLEGKRLLSLAITGDCGANWLSTGNRAQLANAAIVTVIPHTCIDPECWQAFSETSGPPARREGLMVSKITVILPLLSNMACSDACHCYNDLMLDGEPGRSWPSLLLHVDAAASGHVRIRAPCCA